jgi:hypothetical protein
MRNAPLIEAGRAKYTPDLHFGKTELFFETGLDFQFPEVMFDLPDRQITHSPAVPRAARSH